MRNIIDTYDELTISELGVFYQNIFQCIFISF
jgi:hypothetical protein